MEKILNGKEEHAVQVVRTAAGLCARCGEGVEVHVQPAGTCPDKGGSYTWSYTADGMASMMARLEALVAAAKEREQLREKMHPDAREALDFMAGIQLNEGRAPSRAEVAEHFKWDEQRTLTALELLMADGLLNKVLR